jgi:hypothetical protein
MAREGGVSGISRSALISSTFPQIQKIFLKGPGPLKKKKTFLSGLTTLHGALLDHVASGVENWIAECPFYGFSVIAEWGVLRLMVWFS